MDNIKNIDYFIVVPGQSFSQNFINSWTKTIEFLIKNNYSYSWIVSYNPSIAVSRNRALGAYLNGDSFSTKVARGEYKFKKVIFIDSDMVWSVDDFEKLIKSPYDITTGIYSRYDQTYATLFDDKINLISILETEQHNEPFKVGAAGLGFLSCSYDAISKMKFPWFVDSIFDSKSDDLFISEKLVSESEDVYFCNKLKSLGYEIYADPLIRVGHEKPFIIMPHSRPFL